jgi:hypothetical protein
MDHSDEAASGAPLPAKSQEPLLGYFLIPCDGLESGNSAQAQDAHAAAADTAVRSDGAGDNRSSKTETNNVDAKTTSNLHSSNPTFCIPPGLSYTANYVSTKEQASIMADLTVREFRWEGFDRRRRVQRYALYSDDNVNVTVINDATSDVDAYHNSQQQQQQHHQQQLHRQVQEEGVSSSSSTLASSTTTTTAAAGWISNTTVPPVLSSLARRIEQDTKLRPRHVSLEEYNTLIYSQQRMSGSVFEQLQLIDSDADGDECNDSATYFVMYIPLGKAAIQHLNKPLRRQASCWQLESKDHSTDLVMEPGSLMIKSGDCLWNWRYHLEASPAENSDPVFVLKYYLLSPEQTKDGLSAAPVDNFGYIHSADDDIPRGPMPPMKDIVTVIVTTSPIRSNPSTEMLEKTLETFYRGGPDFCACAKIIVCDGYRTQTGQGDVSRKHTNVKQAMRNGIVTDEQADNYVAYKERLRELCENATDGSPFANTTVHELDSRQGYGFALRHALRHMVATPYVCVIQHDRTFMRPTPMKEAMEAMWQHRNVKFIGMNMRSNLTYRDIFLGKYGRKYLEELKEMILRVPELLVDATEYGPESRSTNEMYFGTDKLRENILAVADSYNSSLQKIIEQDYYRDNLLPEGKHQISLTPTLFWYDNTHLCETAHYRDFIFNPLYKMVAKGGFVEDKCSPVMKRTVERLGLKDGHSRFGCYILDDHSGMFFTGHLDGGAYLTQTEKSELRQDSL